MSKIIVALDAMSLDASLWVASEVKGHVWGFKVNDLLLREGVRCVEKLKEYGNVMADPKLFDIPNTVANAVKVLTDYGADFITVHSIAGAQVLRAARDAAGEKAKILAITVLTSDESEDRQAEVRRRAVMAYNCKGAAGLVCAGPDLEGIKDIPLFKVVPGIRPAGKVAGDDQVHISSMIPPLADYVVVGRPICQAKNPLEVVQSLEGKT